MSNRVIYCNCIWRCMAGLLVILTTSAMAQGDVAETLPDYLAWGGDLQSNPWALPQKQAPEPDRRFDLRRSNEYQDKQYQDKQYQDKQYQDNYGSNQVQRYERQERFVTPEILQSLKQQQMRNQRVPDTGGNQRAMPGPQTQQQFGTPLYGMPSYGMGYPAPAYNLPSISPWGNSPDILYQGESLPMVPDEALGGIPPMQVPLFDNEDSNGRYNPDSPGGNDAFNPFTFIPNGDLH